MDMNVPRPVLLVDDDPGILSLMSVIAERAGPGTLAGLLGDVLDVARAESGRAVTVVADAEEAVRAAAGEPFDVLLVDLRMPVLDGFGVAARIRAREAAAGAARLPIVALSADARPVDVAACREAGMDGHLAKPAGSQALHDALAPWLTAVPPVIDEDILRELAESLGSEGPLVNGAG